jgi:mRNA interferase HicA
MSGDVMKFSEFKRQLKDRGVRFEKGKKHEKCWFGSRRSTFPRHQSQEVGEKLRKLILSQLGLED